MDIAELERLLELVRNANIRELTLRQGEARITLRKAPPVETTTGTALVAVYGEETDYLAETAEGQDLSAAGNGAPVATPVASLQITAPLVGVFRHVKPIIGLGARVTEGQVVGVIEAMKLVNEVTAPFDGAVTDVLVEDGMPVEYGQALFILQRGKEVNGSMRK